MPIRVLTEQLASQIAAGEVVERPFSVVKELVENSIDAGATTINIDIREAGRQQIQIADNGQGIPSDELPIAFRRHATSKLQTADDLNAIATLGFRGEALAAIASVSQLTIVSRAAGAPAGVRLSLEAGQVIAQDTVGAPEGTVISVDRLFFNMPARLKFLKSNSTEKKLIDELVTRYALAYPHIRFRLAHNGRITFQSNGTGQVADVLVAIYGAEIARQLLPVELDGQGDGEVPFQVSGFVGPPSLHWSNRSHITLFVNGRWIKDNQLAYAVIQAYQNLLPNGRYPLGIIFLTLPPTAVDVNVHPAKTEVRFRQGKAPFGLVQKGVRQTLLAAAPTDTLSAWSVGSQMQAISPPTWQGQLDSRSHAGEQPAFGLEWDGMALDETGGAADEESQLPIMRVVGQVGASYIITEGPEGLFLIDQQSAHERVLYEQMMAELPDGLISRPLTSGTAVTLSPDQFRLLEQETAVFQQLGFDTDPFGPHTLMIRAIPERVGDQDPAQLLVGLLSALESVKGNAEQTALFLAQRLCQLAALPPGRTLTAVEQSQLIQQLERCRDPLTTPDGNPTFIYLSVAQLAQEFGKF